MIVLEIMCLNTVVGVSRMDRVRNEEVRRRAGIERELASRTDQRVLRWLHGAVEVHCIKAAATENQSAGALYMG